MKLLFLSICGKLNEPEETKYINLYLASLAKFVVPYFENVKVILLTTYNIDNIENSLLQKRINEFGLCDIVELKTIYDMELPEKSLDRIQRLGWFDRIGVHMNILFDFSKKYNFFDADWVFHIDTDTEFLQNFETCIKSINELKKAHPRILISLAGDSYPVNIVNEDKEYLFKEPKRINFYDENADVETHSNFITVEEQVMRDDDHRRKYTAPMFSPAQMKVRNDFVGISREATNTTHYNWVFMYVDFDFNYSEKFKTFWPDKGIKIQSDGTQVEVPMPKIHINYHMGGTLQYRLHSNEVDIARVQLPGYTHAVSHYSSGWFNGTFLDRCFNTLKEKHLDTQHIWETDYLTKEQIETKIQELQSELQRLQKLLN